MSENQSDSDKKIKANFSQKHSFNKSQVICLFNLKPKLRGFFPFLAYFKWVLRPTLIPSKCALPDNNYNGALKSTRFEMSLNAPEPGISSCRSNDKIISIILS